MPKILGDTLAEHRAQIRAQVFEAFTSLMAERGYDAITLSDIAARAGIGRTAIYNHFRDKESVVVALASHEVSSYLESARAAIDAADGPTAALRAYVVHHFRRQGELHFGFGPEMYALLSPEALAQMRGHVVEVESVLVEILRRGSESGDFRIEDVPTVVTLVHACLQPRGLAPDAVAEFIVRALR